ncbi:hypothetical protein B0192_00305 [Leptospira interrogans serovar Australis]|nr:hypothetical protein B0192_00305 [Leptospira interrogans serovar Australis]
MKNSIVGLAKLLQLSISIQRKQDGELIFQQFYYKKAIIPGLKIVICGVFSVVLQENFLIKRVSSHTQKLSFYYFNVSLM